EPGCRGSARRPGRRSADAGMDGRARGPVRRRGRAVPPAADACRAAQQDACGRIGRAERGSGMSAPTLDTVNETFDQMFARRLAETPKPEAPEPMEEDEDEPAR